MRAREREREREGEGERSERERERAGREEEEERESERMSLASFSAPSNCDYPAGNFNCHCNPLRVSVTNATDESVTPHYK